MEIGSALEIYLVKTFSEKEQTLSHIAEKYRFNIRSFLEKFDSKIQICLFYFGI